MENAVTESDRLFRIDDNVYILHGNFWNMVLGIDKKYETLSIYVVFRLPKLAQVAWSNTFFSEVGYTLFVPYKCFIAVE